MPRLLRWCYQAVDQGARHHEALRLVAEGRGLAGELGPVGWGGHIGGGLKKPVGDSDLPAGPSQDRFAGVEEASNRRAHARQFTPEW